MDQKNIKIISDAPHTEKPRLTANKREKDEQKSEKENK